MGAANIFTIGMGAIQYNAQGKIGKFNHLFEPFNSTPKIGTNIKDKKNITNKIIPTL